MSVSGHHRDPPTFTRLSLLPPPPPYHHSLCSLPTYHYATAGYLVCILIPWYVLFASEIVTDEFYAQYFQTSILF